MSPAESAAVALSTPPLIPVRDHEGELVAHVDLERAKELMERGWAEPVGRTKLRFLRLRPNAPQFWRPRRDGVAAADSFTTTQPGTDTSRSEHRWTEEGRAKATHPYGPIRK